MAERGALAGLFAAGAIGWAVLLSARPARLSGPTPTLEDWPKEFRYYAVLRQAVLERRPPLFISRPILSGRKLMAIPELNCTPAVLLLPLLSTPRFVLLDAVSYYAAGFAGLLLLRRRYGLGLPAAAFLFLLFFFNGHLVAHMAIGHSMWAAHFLLPLFVLGLLSLVEGRPAAPPMLALVMFVVLLRGGIHLFASCVLFLLLLAAFNPRRLRPIALTLLAAGALSAVKLMPAAFLARHWHGAFLSGFPSAGDLWASLAAIRGAAEPQRGGVFGRLSWWEYDTYVSAFGLALLLVFGIALARRWPALGGGAERGLYGPIAVLAGLSLGDTYLVLSLTPIPLLNAERVGSRLLLLPVLLLGTLAALRMERLRAAPAGPARTAGRCAVAMAIAGMAALMAVHAWTWRVEALNALLPPRRGLMNVELAPLPHPLAGADLLYVIVVALGAAVTLSSMAAAVLFSRRRGGIHSRSA